MNIRALMITAFGSVVILAGCVVPTPTPVPIATWVAQGIPSDLVIAYSSANDFMGHGEDIRITADGSATRTLRGGIILSDGKSSRQFAGKLSPDALTRVILAFGVKGFFYLEYTDDGCIFDIAKPPTATMWRRISEDADLTSVSIRLNGTSKENQWADGCLFVDESGSYIEDLNVGFCNFRALIDIIIDAVKDLPPVTPTETGAVEHSPTATPTRP